MILSDISIRRPVICIVLSLLILTVGALSFSSLPVREYPDIDAPVVSVSTNYRGAAAEVVETQITDPLEEQLSAIDGVRLMRSDSSEERSTITLEFTLDRDVDSAANDVRDRVGRVQGSLPDEVDPPEVSKADTDDEPILVLSFNSPRYSRLELAELADRIAVQRLQTISGVSQVELRGPRFAMRLWVDSARLAAQGLTVADVEAALRQQNVDVPSGRLESRTREFPVRLDGRLIEVADFENLVLATRDGYQVKFRDVGRVELGSSDYRSDNRFNGRNTVGVRVVRQSQANLLDVAAAVKAMMPEIQRNLPDEVNVDIAYDTSVFVERSVNEVKRTLIEAGVLVVLTIFVFLRDWRATVVPLVAIPVSLVGSFAAMSWMGFSINLLTLLALVLAVGLVVDDAIVMLENIYRRIENGEPPVRAAVFGARQMAFAVIATTLVLIAVFVPVAFQKGSTGRLFYEFGITLALAVTFSSIVALTLTPMLCSRFLKLRRDADGRPAHGWLYRKTEPAFVWVNERFASLLSLTMRRRFWVLGATAIFSAVGLASFTQLQRELTPEEDRGLFRVIMNFPLGSSPVYATSYATEVEKVLAETPEVERWFRSTGGGFSGSASRGFAFVSLKPWEERERSTQEVLRELRTKLKDNTGGLMIVSPVRPLGGRRSGSGGVQLVLQGSDYGELRTTAEKFAAELRESQVLGQIRIEPQPNKPQVDVTIDRARAADLGVPVGEIASTLESLFGGRQVTRFRRAAEEYDVIVQMDEQDRTQPSDLAVVYVRGAGGRLVQLSSLVDMRETSVPEAFPHLDRQRSITVSGQLAPGRTQGDGVAEFEAVAERILPETIRTAWEGETREFVESAGDAWMLFALALLFTFLVLAAQFESWLHPVTIFSGVLVAVAGGVLVLYLSRFWGQPLTDNLFSRFGLIMLIGLVAKNGILIVEFANELQLEGRAAAQAAYEAATLRFRPILMTSISTILGAFPLAIASGAGAESRNPLGVVIVGGLGLSTLITLFVIPLVYILMDSLCVRFTGKGSASGLRRAAEIGAEVEKAEREASSV
ncbi:MAG: efflux RND transporter permease subunit [Opitutaceae bacterium]|jgi:multidrug efflux pump|nr:efflux RND transporter permease subunit [Opitutaceae bacterium]